MVSVEEAYNQLVSALLSKYPNVSWNFEKRITDEIQNCDAVRYWLVPTRKDGVPPIVFFDSILMCDNRKIRKCIGIARPKRP